MDQTESTPTKKNSKGTTPNDPVPVPAVGKANENIPIAEDTKNKGRQKKKINWPAWIQAASGIAIVIITGFYTHYAAQQVEKMKDAVKISGDAVKIARQQVELAERPWVNIQVSVSGPLTFDASGVKARLRFVYKNSGKEPAMNIGQNEELYITHPPVDPQDELRRICGMRFPEVRPSQQTPCSPTRTGPLM